MNRTKIVLGLVSVGAVAVACAGTHEFSVGQTEPDGWQSSYRYTSSSPPSVSLSIKGPPQTKPGCVEAKSADGVPLGGGPLVGGCFSGVFPGNTASICITVPWSGPCPPLTSSDLAGGGTAQPAQREFFEIIEMGLSSGDYRHVVVRAPSLDEAHAIAGPFLADPLTVPRPPEVGVNRIRLVDPVDLTPGVDVFLLQSAELDVFDIEANGVWAASLGRGVSQTFHPESGGLFLTQFSIPLEALDVVTGLDPETENRIEWMESRTHEDELKPGSFHIDTK